MKRFGFRLTRYVILFYLAWVPVNAICSDGIVLVLGGGGARGMAHIGVLKVLERERIPVSMVVGTSAGAMVGGAFVAGLSPGQMEERLEDINLLELLKVRPLGELGFIPWTNIEQWLNVILPVHRIEETTIPYAAVATNLYTGQPEVFTSGSLIKAMCASAAIPLIFHPVLIDTTLYVDGGISSDVPISIASGLCDGPIVAVITTGAIEGMKIDSKWDILYKSFYIMQWREINLVDDKADLIIRPDVGFYNLADLKYREEIIMAGERAASDAVEDIKRLLNDSD